MIITSIPGAAMALARYVKDPSNPLDYRGAAFDVLRYVDREQFKAASAPFEKEFAHANISTREHLEHFRFDLPQ